MLAVRPPTHPRPRLRFSALRHYAVDLETLALGPDAVVLSAALARFGPAFGPPRVVGSWVLDAVAQQRDGRAVDADTCLWWLRQPDAPRLAVAGEAALASRVHPRTFLCELVELLAPPRSDGTGRDLDFALWAKPMHFDLAILEHMAAQYRAPAREGVFHRRRLHNARTLYEAVNLARPTGSPDLDEPDGGGPAHDAAADALRTAETLAEGLEELLARGRPSAGVDLEGSVVCVRPCDGGFTC